MPCGQKKSGGLKTAENRVARVPPLDAHFQAEIYRRNFEIYRQNARNCKICDAVLQEFSNCKNKASQGKFHKSRAYTRCKAEGSMQGLWWTGILHIPAMAKADMDDENRPFAMGRSLRLRRLEPWARLKARSHGSSFEPG
jgi:hypothetical protein